MQNNNKTAITIRLNEKVVKKIRKMFVHEMATSFMALKGS